MTITTSAPRHGFIYVLRNACMPGIYVIGWTDRPPSEVCAELSGSSDTVPFPYEVVCFGEITDRGFSLHCIRKFVVGREIPESTRFFRLDRIELLELICAIEEECKLVAKGDLRFLDHLSPERNDIV